MRGIRVTVLIALCFPAACGDGGPVPRSGESKASGAPDLTADQSTCEHLADALDVLQRLVTGTLTSSEAVERLAAVEASIEGDADLFRAENASEKAALVDDLATAMGRLKVAAESGNLLSVASEAPAATEAIEGLRAEGLNCKGVSLP
ncbi:hypothetical protein BH20ACT24_BH20ACT24_01820 [soil metagenome]